MNPDILILDEATANVDQETESIIHRAANEVMRGRTCLIIAHRLSTIMNCDQVIVMNKGSVLERGSHTDLLNRRGSFYELWAAQKEAHGMKNLQS